MVRDALGPMVPAWLGWIGAATGPVQRVPDDAGALASALEAPGADLVVTTGSSARGPRDHLRAVLATRGATLVCDGVAVRPGHPMVLARLADGRPLVGLPGNPLAAISGLVTLAAPLLQSMLGLPPAEPGTAALSDAVAGHPVDVRLVPVANGRPLHYVGPAMLRGLAHADGLAVVPPGGADRGQLVEVLRLPQAG
jgi:molybdopterin molybdotransferase